MLQAEILNRRTLEGTTLVLWLYHRHALKAFRASVGNEKGHDYFKGFVQETLL